MPRKVREIEDGGIYHVFNRGNNRMDLFRESKDFAWFYSLWIKGKEKYPCDVFHYCFMNNHYHILVRMTLGSDLKKLLHDVQLGYVRYFKKKHRFIGRLFQERYRSPRIGAESYYLQCGRYIERNPVKAGLVGLAEDYEYSSARYYVKGKDDSLVTPNLYYDGLGRNTGERRKKYRNFLAMDEPYSPMIDRMLLVSP